MTPVDLNNQLLAYSDFDSPVDVAKARKYVQTARKILSLGIVEYQGTAGVRQRFDLQFLRDEINRTISFIKANDSTVAPAANIFASMENFRAD
jgi:hypothetical protein